MQTTQCPICNSDIIIEQGAAKKDLVDCLNCSTELEIISLQPLQLEPFDESDE